MELFDMWTSCRSSAYRLIVQGIARLRSHTAKHFVASFCVAMAAVSGLASCGGDNASSVAVARVAGVGTISQAMLEHWIPIEAVVLYEEYPTKPVPKGLIPDPPDYTACIGYLRNRPQKIIESKVEHTTAELKGKCRARYRELKELTLNTLIGWYWTVDAGLELGMKASKAEINRRYAEVNKRYWPKASEYTTYLKLTGQTISDMMFRYRVQVFEKKLIEKQAAIEKSLPQGPRRQRTLNNLVAYESGKHWVSSTTCLTTYVVSGCKQYKGPDYPGIPN